MKKIQKQNLLKLKNRIIVNNYLRICTKYHRLKRKQTKTNLNNRFVRISKKDLMILLKNRKNLKRHKKTRATE